MSIIPIVARRCGNQMTRQLTYYFPANTNYAGVSIYGGSTTLSFPKGNGSLQGGNSEYWQISDLLTTKYIILNYTFITNDLS